jgi:hypothetical protein
LLGGNTIAALPPELVDLAHNGFLVELELRGNPCASEEESAPARAADAQTFGGGERSTGGAPESAPDGPGGEPDGSGGDPDGPGGEAEGSGGDTGGGGLAALPRPLLRLVEPRAIFRDKTARAEAVQAALRFNARMAARRSEVGALAVR